MRKKIVFTILILVFLIFYLVVGEHFHIFIFCPIKKFLGLYCPGCGITRMLLSILKGNFEQAFRYNPLIFLMLPFFVFYYLDYLYSCAKKKKTHFSVLEPGIWYFLIIIFLIYGLLRNIPFFDFLKPTSLSFILMLSS